MEILPNNDPGSPGYIPPLQSLCIDLRHMANVVLDSRRLEAFAELIESEFDNHSIERLNIVASNFSSSVAKLFEAAKVIWKRQDVAIDVYQEIFALEELDRFLTLDIEPDCADPEQHAYHQSNAKLNVAVLTRACAQMPDRLRRLAFRVEAYSFVVEAESFDEAKKAFNLSNPRPIPAVQVRILKDLWESDGTEKNTLQKIADDLGCGKGTVSTHIKKMKEAGLVESVPSGGFCLTASGKERFQSLNKTDQN